MNDHSLLLDDAVGWRARLMDWACAEGVPLEPASADSLIGYASRVLEWSRSRARLVGRHDPEWLLREQIVPSLLALRVAPRGCDGLVDVGAGAGIVGITCALARPVLRAVLIESVRRKYLFLYDTVRRLNPDSSRLSAVCGRAEETARLPGMAGSFSLVTARGVGGPETALPLAAPFLRPGGRVVILRASSKGSGQGEQRASRRFRLAKSVRSAVADVRADAWELSEPGVT